MVFLGEGTLLLTGVAFLGEETSPLVSVAFLGEESLLLRLDTDLNVLSVGSEEK